MSIRNIFLITLLFTSAYNPITHCAESTSVSKTNGAPTQEQPDDISSLFSSEDTFDHIELDLNQRPHNLPLWKRAGAWIFIKCYWPIKRVVVWYQGKKKASRPATKS